jgi:arsenate reductase
MKRMLFLCTHNSARSQMAEGLLRELAGDRFEALSAGTEVTRVHPLAIEAMQELGIDISGHRSKSIDEFRDAPPDIVVSVCDNAREACPYLPGVATRLHWSFPDPSASNGTESEKLERFREVRNAIRARLAEFLASS